jgi:hypothetical protein
VQAALVDHFLTASTKTEDTGVQMCHKKLEPHGSATVKILKFVV